MQKILCLAALLLCVRLSAQWAPQPRMTVEPIARYGKIADTLFALTEGFLYKSTDDGQHWNLLPDVPLAPPNFASNDRNLWINPDNQRIYIQDIFTLLESRDYGQSWQVLELPGVQAPVFTMGFRGDTIYLADLTLLFRRVDDQWSLVRDFAAGGAYPSIQRIKVFGPVLLVDTYLTGVWRSADEGDTWSQVVPATNWGTWLSTRGDTLLALNGPDADLYRSTDQGLNWQTGSAAGAGLDYLADGEHIFIATAKDGRVYQSIDGLSNWQPVLALAPNDILYDVQETGQELLLGTAYGTVRRAGPGWEISNNGFLPSGLSTTGELNTAGETLITEKPLVSAFDGAASQWSAPYPPGAFASVVFHNNYLIGHQDTTLTRYRTMPSLAFDTLVAAGFQGHRLFSIAGKLYGVNPGNGAIAQSDDNGLTWEAKGAIPAPINTFGMSGQDDQLFWWATGGYILYGSPDGGLTWNDLHMFDGPIAALVVANDTLFAFVEAPGYLFFSTDHGLSFHQPPLAVSPPFNALTRFDRCWADSTDLVVLDKKGQFYLSPDHGLNWLALPAAPNAGLGGSGARTGSGWYYDREQQLYRLPPDAVHIISGGAYADINGNGQRDADENGVPFQLLELLHADRVITTDAQGNFAFVASQLPDTLRPQARSNFEINPPYYVLTGDSSGIHFAFQPQTQITDLEVNLVAQGVFRPGFSNKLTATLRNNGTLAASGQLRLIKDYRTGVQAAEPVYTALNADTLLWDYSLGPLEVRQYQISLNLSPFTSLGEVLLFHAAAEQPGDATPDDNVFLLSDTIVGAYDPNDKSVFPAEIAANLLEPGTAFTYTIRFQNEGNYPTAFVSVHDTLAGNLDIRTLRVLAASHPLQVEWPGGREVVFRFNPLVLPPKSQQELESQGFVQFSIKPAAGLTVGDQVPNRAAIYFDYNPPVVTNTVQTTISQAVATGEIAAAALLHVFPNPASRQVQIEAPISGERVYLVDQAGHVIYQQEISGKQATCMLPALPAGAYWLKWEAGKRVFVRQLVISSQD